MIFGATLFRLFSLHFHRLPDPKVARIIVVYISESLVPAKQHLKPLQIFYRVTFLSCWQLPALDLVNQVYFERSPFAHCRICGLFIMSQDTGLFSIKRPREVLILCLSSAYFHGLTFQ